jgi:hypothetical protein
VCMCSATSLDGEHRIVVKFYILPSKSDFIESMRSVIEFGGTTFCELFPSSAAAHSWE